MYYVYLIKSEQKGKNRHAKIGRTKDLEGRLRSLQTANKDRLYIYRVIPCKSEAHAVWLERCIHKEFKELQVRGEWYKLSTNLENFLDGILTEDAEKQDRAVEKHKAQVEKGHFKWKRVKA